MDLISPFLPPTVFSTLAEGKLALMNLPDGLAQTLFDDVLAALPQVGVVDIVPQTIDTFNQFARLTVQGESWNPDAATPSGQVRPPLDLRGFRGAGEVVGVMDTGIDLESCWWADPEGDAPGPDHFRVDANIDPDGAGGGLADLDDDNGHGTHVACPWLHQ